MATIQQRGDRVLAVAIEQRRWFDELVRLAERGWRMDGLAPVLESGDAELVRQAAFVVAEAPPAAVAPLRDPILVAFPSAQGIAQADLLDALIRQPSSPARDAAIATAAADESDVIAKQASREVARWTI